MQQQSALEPTDLTHAALMTLLLETCVAVIQCNKVWNIKTMCSIECRTVTDWKQGYRIKIHLWHCDSIVWGRLCGTHATFWMQNSPLIYFFSVWSLTCHSLPWVDAKLIALWSPPPDANGIQSDLKRKRKKWVNNELKGTSFKCAVVAHLSGRNEKATSHSLIPQPLYL